MIQYTKNLFKKIKELSVLKKILLFLAVAIYFGIIAICSISFKYNYTSPGTLNRINEVINIEDVEITNSFYTVSVFSETKRCSLLEYWLRKADRKQDIITEEEYNSVLTRNEEIKQGEAQKNQSIQDSIICAYDIAKENGYDVDIKKTYVGVCICYMPCNYFETGPESIQIKDIIKKIGDEEITSSKKLAEVCDYYLENDRYKDSSLTVPVIEIERSGESITLDKCNARCLAQIAKCYEATKKYCDDNKISNEYSFLTNYYYDYYELDTENSKPKFSVNKASSIGPSGGLCQTLYVYNALTNNSITIEGSLITATGTIVNDGSVGVIGAVDKKVYTIDIYMSKFFFVPEKDYDDAINAYNTIKDPKFDIVSVKNVRDAINFLVEFKEITEGGN